MPAGRLIHCCADCQAADDRFKWIQGAQPIMPEFFSEHANKCRDFSTPAGPQNGLDLVRAQIAFRQNGIDVCADLLHKAFNLPLELGPCNEAGPSAANI